VTDSGPELEVFDAVVQKPFELKAFAECIDRFFPGSSIPIED
jgi:hypothetical protein